MESGRNVVKELFKEGIERWSKRASSGAMPERIIIFCSLTTGAQDEENIFNSKYLKSAICGIYEAYKLLLSFFFDKITFLKSEADHHCRSKIKHGFHAAM